MTKVPTRCLQGFGSFERGENEKMRRGRRKDRSRLCRCFALGTSLLEHSQRNVALRTVISAVLKRAGTLTSTSQEEFLRISCASVGAAVIAHRGYRKGSLSWDGAVAAFAVGALTLGVTFRLPRDSAKFVRETLVHVSFVSFQRLPYLHSPCLIVLHLLLGLARPCCCSTLRRRSSQSTRHAPRRSSTRTMSTRPHVARDRFSVVPSPACS